MQGGYDPESYPPDIDFALRHAVINSFSFFVCLMKNRKRIE